MRIAIIGSRWFGSEVLKILHAKGHDLHVVAPDAGDRLAQTAVELGYTPVLHTGRRKVTHDDLPGEFDVVLGAHSHAFIPLDKAKIASLGYHPSLLPRWRGIAAVEWTAKAGDPVAGGSVYHLTDEMDAGGIAAQDWCFVLPGEDAGSLWRRELGPMGLRLIAQVIDEIAETGACKAEPQDERFVTLAPRIKESAPAA